MSSLGQSFSDHSPEDEFATPVGEEHVRFVRNFNDIFLSMGILMFAIGLAFIAMVTITPLAGPPELFDTDGNFVGGARFVFIAGSVFLVCALIMWGLGEIVARKRRMFLPAIVVLLTFTTFMVLAAAGFYLSIEASSAVEKIQENGFRGGSLLNLANQFKTMPLVLFTVATFSVLAFYIRTKLPFAMGVGSAAFAGVVISFLFMFKPHLVVGNFWVIAFLSGAFLFLLGMFFDARDPLRQTRFADNGFWLHFLAGPVIFFSVMAMTVGVGGAVNSGSAIVTLIIVSVFAVISLLINRRALLVSGILSAVGAVLQLVGGGSTGGVMALGITFFVLGSAIVILGSAWSSLRRILIAPFPKSGFIARIIPPETVID